MDRNELDNLLAKLPNIVKGNYPFLRFTGEMREAVHERTAGEHPSFNEYKAFRPFLLSSAAVFLVFLLLGGISPLIFGGFGRQADKISSITQVEAIAIDLDGEGTPEIVNTWKIKEAEGEEKLVALIWARDSSGEWRVVSSEPIAGGTLLPIEVLKPEQQNGHLVVISATGGQDDISYRVMGFKRN